MSHTGSDESESSFLLDQSGSSESESEDSYNYSSESESDDNREVGLLQSARLWVRVNPNQPEPSPPRFPFTGKSKLNFDVEDKLSFFNLMFDDELVNKITTETNRYTNQQGRGVFRRIINGNKWKLTNNEEIRVFLALYCYKV